MKTRCSVCASILTQTSQYSVLNWPNCKAFSHEPLLKSPRFIAGLRRNPKRPVKKNNTRMPRAFNDLNTGYHWHGCKQFKCCSNHAKNRSFVNHLEFLESFLIQALMVWLLPLLAGTASGSPLGTRFRQYSLSLIDPFYPGSLHLFFPYQSSYYSMLVYVVPFHTPVYFAYVSIKPSCPVNA